MLKRWDRRTDGQSTWEVVSVRPDESGTRMARLRGPRGRTVVLEEAVVESTTAPVK